MHVRFVYRGSMTVPDMICSADLVFDDGDGPLAGMWLRGFEIWHGGPDGIAVSLPCAPRGAPGYWSYFEFLRGYPEAVARLKAFIIDAYRNRGELWTCPGCYRMNPVPAPPAGSDWTCAVCGTLARSRQHESPILDTLRNRDAPIPPPLRRVPKPRAPKFRLSAPKPRTPRRGR